MSNSIAPPPLRKVALGDLANELVGTRRVLERVPEDQLEWRPHARSMSLGELTTHLVNLLFWQNLVLEREELDLDAVPSMRSVIASRTEWLDEFDRNAAKLQELLDAAGDAELSGMWTLRKGGHSVFTLPRVAALRGMGISHLVHHRGQLTVYLRMLDVPVPGLYGPSADEMRAP
jgi:uncharacterized damage-inducible protein DinB